MPQPIKTLLISTLYPSVARPLHGIFVETRLRELLNSGQVDSRVVAPVPWFPSKNPRFGRYSIYAATPAEEIWNDVLVSHPRYFLPPKVGMNIAPYTLARCALPSIRKIISGGFDFDLIDAHYYYPDGVAAGIIARVLNKPFVVTARGSDLNLISKFSVPKRLILKTADKAAASIGVSKTLVEALSSLGADTKKLRVIPNGIDRERFHPVDQQEARSKLKLPNNRRILISVGNLIELKGHDISIKAIAKLREDERLVIIGDGPERSVLEKLAKDLNLGERVLFVGQVPNTELKWWYSAADVMLLCSSHEGRANVLLESMACGTPVIATNIPGNTEVVTSRIVGRLMARRDSDSLVKAYVDLFSSTIDKTKICKYVEKHTWAATTYAQISLFREIARSRLS